MKLAVIEVAGKQYLVKKGETIETEKLEAQVGEKLSLPRVLMTWDGKKLELGRPYLEDYSAEVEVLAKGKGPKVIVFKYKRRKDYRRKVGHRQIVFQVKFNTVSAPSPAEKEPEEAAETKKKPAVPAVAVKKPATPAKAVKKPPAPAKAKKAPAKTAKKTETASKKKAAPKAKPAAKKS